MKINHDFKDEEQYETGLESNISSTPGERQNFFTL